MVFTVVLLGLGLLVLVYLFFLVRELRATRRFVVDPQAKPLVPVNLIDNTSAVIVSEERGHLVYMNDHARRLFGMNGETPNLTLLARKVQPSDTFRDIFAAEGLASFRVGKLQVEATSHVIPTDTGRRMIVVMKEKSQNGTPVQKYDPVEAVSVIGEISVILAESRELEDTLSSILHRVGTLIPYDNCEINYWHADQFFLRPIARLGDPGYSAALEKAGGTYRIDEGYSGWIARYRQPIIISDSETRQETRPKVTDYTFRSYVGVPLLVGDRFLGTLELASRTAYAFDFEDLTLLQTLAGQVAVAIENSRLYREQTSRVAELSGLQQIAQAMTVLTEPSKLFQHLNSSIAGMIGVEMCGVMLLNEDSDELVGQRPLYGIVDPMAPYCKLDVTPGSPGYKLWQESDWWYTNDAYQDLTVEQLGISTLVNTGRMHSVAVVPMLVGNQRVGAVLVANPRSGRGFSDDDMQLLAAFAAQVAIVVENARLYSEEQRRAEELEGLQQVAQAVELLHEPAELYRQITARIATLTQAQKCGLFLYEPNANVLVSRPGFYGHDGSEYTLAVDGLVAELWQNKVYWYHNNLLNDPQIMRSELGHLAAELEVKKMAVAALQVGRDRLGLVVVANDSDGHDFDEEEARLMNLFAGQAAVLVNNASLYSETRRRAVEADGLRKIAEIVSGAVRLEDIIQQVLGETTALLNCEMAALGLLDSEKGDLVYKPENVYGRKLSQDFRLDIFSPGFSDSVVLSRRPFRSDNVNRDKRVLSAYRVIIDELHLTNTVTIPVVFQNRVIGELSVGNKHDGIFTDNDVALLNAVAAQIASAVERTRLYQATDKDLRNRVDELNALDRISINLSESLDLDRILEIVRSEVLQGTAADDVTVLLLAPPNEWYDEKRPLVEKRVGAGDVFPAKTFVPIEEQSWKDKRAVFISDYLGSDLSAVPESARSALVEPIVIEGEYTGLVHVASKTPNAFSSSLQEFVARVTKQSSLAVANARRYREQLRMNEMLRGRADQLSKVYTLGETIREGATLEKVLGDLARTLSQTVGFRVVLMNVWDKKTQVFRRVAQYGLTSDAFKEAQQITPTLDRIQKLLHDRWKMGSAYFLPAEYQAEWMFDGLSDEISQHITVPQEEGSHAWNPEDLFLIPFYGSDEKLLGWFSVDDPANGRRPTAATVETLEFFAAEAAFSVENYFLLENIQAEAAGTQAERDRLAQLHKVAQEIQLFSDIPSRLDAVARGIQASGWQKVRITMRDENLENTLLIHVGYKDDELPKMRAAVLPGEVWRERLADPEFQSLRVGAAYYLRYDQPWVQQYVLRGEKPVPEQVAPDEWHPQDILYLPLYGQGQSRVIGIIGLEMPVNNTRPTEPDLQVIELFAVQAAAAMENTRLYLETVHQRENEQRLSVMMEAVASSLDMETVIRTLADGLQQMIAFTRMHVALPTEDGSEFHLQRVELTADGQVHLFDDKPLPARSTSVSLSYRENRALLYHLRGDTQALTYPDLRRWYEQGERITLMVPMITGGRTLGVLRLGSELENAFGFSENIDLVRRMANLSAVAIEHSRLLDDLRAEKAYSEAVVQSIQQGIIVLDTNHRITSVNAFMQQRYGWQETAVGQILYDYETEFGDFLRHSIDSALAEGVPYHQFDILFDSKLKETVTGNFYTYPLRQGDAVTGAVLLIEDVSERAKLQSDLEQRAEQLRALSQVSSQITSNLDTDSVISVILQALDRVIPYDGVSLWLREGTRLRVAAAQGYKHPDVASAEELVGLYVDIDSSALFREMSENRQVVNVGNIGANDPRFPYGEALPYKNWLGAPLIYQNAIVGVIAVEKEQPYFYSVHHEQLLLTFANQAAVSLNNAQLFEQTNQRASELRNQAQRLELLNRVAVSLAQSLDIENILEITLRETAKALEIQEAAAIKIDHENDLGRIVVEYPRGHQAPNKVYPLPDNRVVARIRETLLPFIIEDFQNSPLADDLRPFMRSPEKVRSALIVPLVVGGTVIGAMQFEVMEDYYDFSEERLEIAQTLASQAAIAVQNASLFEQSVVRTHELETLFEAAQATAITLDLNEAMRRVVSQMLSALRADACSIALWDDIENKLEIHAAINAWGDTDYADLPGTIYELNEFPVRERVLRQRQVVAMRLGQKDVDPREISLMERRGATSRLLVPLVVNDLSIGLIELEIREQNRYFETADVRLARTLASNAAVAIENARLQTETRSHIEELYIINDLSTAVSSTVDVDELFPIVRDQLPVLLDADVLYVALFDREKSTISFPIAVQSEGGDLTLPPLPMGNDEFSYVIRRKGPLLLAGSQMVEARRSFGISDPFMPDTKCFLGVPMVSGEEVVGVLAVQDNENPRAFGLNDQRILTTVAAQLGVAIQNARLFEQTAELAQGLEIRVNERTSELDQERERVSTLYDITSEVAASLDIQRILSVALEKVARAIGATTAVILGIDEISERLYVLHAYGEEEPVPDDMRTQLAQDEGLAGWVLQNQTNVVIEDVQNDPRWLVASDRDRRQRAAVASLLQGGDDVRGVMMLFSEKVGAFNADHLKLVAAAASQLANAMNNSELYSLIRDQAERLGAILRTEQIESTKNTAIINSVADGVMYANESGTIVLFNTAAERILQLPAERVVNRPIRELAGLYGGSGGDWLAAINRWTSDPASYMEGDFVELAIELGDGRTINVRLSPVNMGDQFLGTVSVIRDITQLMEVDRLKTEFVSTVSHELRTPMTSIKGYADLLLLGAAGEISEAQQRFLETIKQNADRLSILVNDLLEVSKIDQNRVPLRFTEVEVPDLLERTRSHLEGRTQDSNKPMQINVNMEAALPKIWADYDKTLQVMQNLADNAFNYTPADGVITLVARQEGDAVVMSVSDTGVGIPKEIQDRVFDRFFRGDEYESLVLDTPGTGLGLSIVKSLVEMHKGSIWFESEVGKGTTFYVKMPTAKSS